VDSWDLIELKLVEGVLQALASLEVSNEALGSSEALKEIVRVVPTKYKSENLLVQQPTNFFYLNHLQVIKNHQSEKFHSNSTPKALKRFKFLQFQTNFTTSKHQQLPPQRHGDFTAALKLQRVKQKAKCSGETVKRDLMR
jgi:hypothetical protein